MTDERDEFNDYLRPLRATQYVAIGVLPSVTVSLHPLVIANICRHWTRIREARAGYPLTVVGALCGKRTGREIDIMNSFELVGTEANGDMYIEMCHYYSRESQFKRVFDDMDFVGWYTTSRDLKPRESDIINHLDMCTINRNAILLLKLDPCANDSRTKIPITVCYESIVDYAYGGPVILYVESPYVIAAEETEPAAGATDRVALVRTATMLMSNDDDDDDEDDHTVVVDVGVSHRRSIRAEYLTTQLDAIKTYQSYAKLMLEYVKAVRNKDEPLNREVLREVRGACNRLPIIRSPEFDVEFYARCCDVALTTYQNSITKCCHYIDKVVSKFDTAK